MTGFLRLLLDLVLAFVAPRAVLVGENLVLRQQLIVLRRQIKRPRLRRFDRWLIAALAGRDRALLGAVLVVKPETVIRWPRPPPGTRIVATPILGGLHHRYGFAAGATGPPMVIPRAA